MKQSTIGAGRRLAAMALAAPLALGGCSSEAPATETQAAVSQAAAPLPEGTHALKGRTLTVRLPYRLSDWTGWAADETQRPADLFVFQSLDVERGAGPGGTDLAVFVFEARGSGTETLDFALVPIGKDLPGAPELIRQGKVLKRYQATVTVP